MNFNLPPGCSLSDIDMLGIDVLFEGADEDQCLDTENEEYVTQTKPWVMTVPMSDEDLAALQAFLRGI